jgi:acetyl esterase/lipase
LSAIFAVWLIAEFRAASDAEPSYEVIRNVAYVERSGEALRADVYRPLGEGPFPAVLCIHGGAWASGNKNQLATVAERLAEHGYTAVAISYRLAPQHKFPAQIDDCREALAWMRRNAKQYKIDPDRLAAWGYSAGGHLAALLGVGGVGLKATVAGGAPCDFRQIPPNVSVMAFWLGGTRKELPDVYKAASPAALVTAEAPPFFFYHGEKDSLVPLAGAKAMAALLKESRVSATVYVVPEAGHIAAFLNREAVTEGVKFLDQQLKKSASAGEKSD